MLELFTVLSLLLIVGMSAFVLVEVLSLLRGLSRTVLTPASPGPTLAEIDAVECATQTLSPAQARLQAQSALSGDGHLSTTPATAAPLPLLDLLHPTIRSFFCRYGAVSNSDSILAARYLALIDEEAGLVRIGHAMGFDHQIFLAEAPTGAVLIRCMDGITNPTDTRFPSIFHAIAWMESIDALYAACAEPAGLPHPATP